MNPITHLLAGWTVAEQSHVSLRDKKIITWAGVIPDLDGVSVIPDIVNQVLGRPPSEYYFRYHHSLTHGLPAAVLCAGAVFLIAQKRLKTALFAVLSFHLHLLCDLVGSRGPDPSDIWPLPYLEPFSRKLTFSWSGQWPLDAWPNIAFTIALLLLVFVRAVRRGYSPVSLFSARADAVFVSTLRTRFSPGQKI